MATHDRRAEDIGLSRPENEIRGGQGVNDCIDNRIGIALPGQKLNFREGTGDLTSAFGHTWNEIFNLLRESGIIEGEGPAFVKKVKSYDDQPTLRNFMHNVSRKRREAILEPDSSEGMRDLILIFLDEVLSAPKHAAWKVRLTEIAPAMGDELLRMFNDNPGIDSLGVEEFIAKMLREKLKDVWRPILNELSHSLMIHLQDVLRFPDPRLDELL